MALLNRLIDRAAAIGQPFNAQDAILIVKALNTLHIPNGNTQKVCEKAAFSIASAPQQVSPAVAVDVLNTLTSLRAYSQPIVHSILTRRLTELKSSSPMFPPQTIQKAAVALMKMGKRYAPTEVCDDVLRLIHTMLRDHTSDRGLRLAYIGLFPYSSYMGKHLPLTAPLMRPSLVTLLECGEDIWSSDPSTLRGNAALQAAHLYIPLSVPLRAAAGTTVEDTTYEGLCSRWEALANVYMGSVNMDGIGAGGFARILLDFSVSVRRSGRLTSIFLDQLSHPQWYMRAGIHEFHKGVTAINEVLETGWPSFDSEAASSAALKKTFSMISECVAFVSKQRTQLLAEEQTSLMSAALVYQLVYRYLSAGGTVAPPAALAELVDTLHATTAIIRKGSTNSAASLDLTTSIFYHVCRMPMYGDAFYTLEQRMVAKELWATIEHSLTALSIRAKLQVLYGITLLYCRRGDDAPPTCTAWGQHADAVVSAVVADPMTFRPGDIRMLVDTIRCSVKGGTNVLFPLPIGKLVSVLVARANETNVDEALLPHFCDAAVEKAFGVEQPEGVVRYLNVLHLFLRFFNGKSVNPRSAAILLDSVFPRTKATGAIQRSAAAIPPMLRRDLIAFIVAQSHHWANSFRQSSVVDRDTVRSFLRCAEHARQLGIPIECMPTSSTMGNNRLSLPITYLLRHVSFTCFDAAHLVRLISDEICSAGFAHAAEEDVRQLVDHALQVAESDETETACLVLLLQANRDLKPATLLFSRTQSATLFQHTTHVIAQTLRRDASERGTHDLNRILHAFLESQVLLSHAGRVDAELLATLSAARRRLDESTSPGKIIALKIDVLCDAV